MQRRLTIALTLTAVISILLVGAGVLAMARFSARADAEDQVGRGLDIVARLLNDQNQTGVRFDQALSESRQDFQLAVLGIGIVDPDGELRSLPERGRRQVPLTDELPPIDLDPDQRAALDDGGKVFIADSNEVIGVRTVRLDRLQTQLAPGARVVVVGSQQVSTVAGRTLWWFLTSSALVLTGAAAAGAVLARRFVDPLRDIQAATTAIAAGDLSARVEATGNDEVAELGEAVNRMAADLQRSKALDRQFLMSVSHDLKTPLTAISGYAEALEDGAAEDPRAAGTVIGSNAARLDRLVGDLLDLAKLDANRFRFDLRTFDLAVSAGRAVAGLTHRANEHGLALTTAGVATLPVVADPDRTAQAIGNLIDNALKFAKTSVVVEVQPVTAGEATWAVVSVRDDGPGIRPDDLPHIFDRLYTGSAQPERAENPTGLGLAIVRELAGSMGGHVRAANAAAGGAVLSIALPAAINPAGDYRTNDRGLDGGAGGGDPGDRTATMTMPGGPPPPPDGSVPTGR
ncbi:MAG: HAMP domain-containing sensor histidine kinase [Actinomycetota bacterium]